jgi:anaerobic magnesium-protoporphyrin IX monomethyl ester cyclase
MKITLINVQISEGNNIVPPLGILYIASVLELMKHEVQVFDIDPDVTECVEQIKTFGPQVIGMSCYTNTYKKALRLNEKLRRELSEAVFVTGGVHATAKPLETMTEMRPDYLVYAEGERTIAQLVSLIEAGTKEGLEDIKGLYYWKDGQIKGNITPDLIDDLDSIPFPARHLLSYEPYLVPPGMIRGYVKGRVTTIFTSRGCPYPCTYCASSNVQGKKIRRRTAENVVEELTQLVSHYRINGFYICDDLVTGDRDWIMEFCRKLADSGLGLIWACQSRVDTLDEEMLREMKKSGCVQIDFGVESGSDKTLETMRKSTTVQAARQTFAMTKKVGVRSCATFIIGFQGETEKDMEETFNFAKEINADYTAFYFLTPYPGTPIYHTAVQNNWLDPKIAQSEKFTHRQVGLPLMAIEYAPERLASIRRRFQNYFFLRNYFRWHNLGFYASVLSILCRRPAETVRCIVRFFKTLRLDDLVESVFEIHQRWHRTRILPTAAKRPEYRAVNSDVPRY